MAVATFSFELETTDDDGPGIRREKRLRWALASGLGPGEMDRVSLTASTFNALSPPTGAKAVMIFVGSAVSLVLRGISGDTGVALTPASAPIALPVILPISSPSIGIYNGSASAQSVDLIWL